MSDESQWNKLAKSFHWIIALFIPVAASLGWLADLAATSPGKLQLSILHNSIGLTVLALMVLRLIWKLLSPSPKKSGTPNGINARTARIWSVKPHPTAMISISARECGPNAN